MAKTKKKKGGGGKKVLPLQGKDKVVSKEADVNAGQDESAESVSLMERVKRESKEWGQGGRGKKRELAKMAFALWLSLPVRYRGAPDGVLTSLGLAGDLFDLAKLGTQKDLGDALGVSHGTLAEWRKDIEESDDGKDHRKLFRNLMREGLGALYRKLIENGDAERFKVFAQYVENWMPGMAVQHSGEISSLDDEERAALDKLIAKNRA